MTGLLHTLATSALTIACAALITLTALAIHHHLTDTRTPHD